MRFLTLFLIVFMLNSCVGKEESLKQEYLQKGGEIVNLTQFELLKNVSHAIKTGGPAYAIDFCNLRAMQIKDSLSQLNNCQISRIAIKYRNPSDMPKTDTEKDQLYQYQEAGQNGQSVEPKVYLFDDRIEYYKPIFIDKGTCLICHGNPGIQISEETLEKIKLKYPNDLATGFALNDFRGAWKITFQK